MHGQKIASGQRVPNAANDDNALSLGGYWRSKHSQSKVMKIEICCYDGTWNATLRR